VSLTLFGRFPKAEPNYLSRPVQAEDLAAKRALLVPVIAPATRMERTFGFKPPIPQRTILMSIFNATNKNSADVWGSLDVVDRKTRMHAVAIDAGIVLAILACLYVVFWCVGLRPSGMIGNVVMIMIGAVAYIGINYKFLEDNGQTIGSKKMGIKVTCLEGMHVRVDDLIIKRILPVWAVALIPWVGPLVVLVNYLLILRENQLCGHDEISQTRVIEAQ